MGRVFIEEVMQSAGVNKYEIVALLAFIKRTGRANNAAEAIRKLEAGEFNVNALEEEMIRSFQLELPDEELI